MKTIFRRERDYFISPSRGRLDFDRMIDAVAEFMTQEDKARYNIIVGADSRADKNRAYFVTVLVVHKVGRGARYFWQASQQEKIVTLRDRIYQEAWLSLALAERFLKAFHQKTREVNGFNRLHYQFEIHVDIGTRGPTKDLIKEVVGMIEGNGYHVKTKPEAYGAMTVADKHT